MNENQNWTQLNFGRAGMKSNVRKEKKYRKGKKKVHCSPTASPPYTCIWPLERGWCHTSKAIAEGRCAYDAQRAQALSTRVNHIFFLILFIFVKKPNCSSFKLTITKNYDENTKNLLGISFFNGNIVISPCNQSFRRLKSLWTTILIFFLLSSVFKLFHSAFKVLNDWFIPDQYDNNK